ncbi:MAG: polysaccharide biosynthesis tyrosine autokinase [Chitinophagaceae bacterium]
MKQQHIDSDELVMKEKDTDFNLNRWIIRMLRMWPWFLLSLLACLALAFFYLKYKNPVFNSVAAVMVKDEKKGADLMNSSVFSEMGFGSSNKLVENEIEILKSYDLMEEVVGTLQLFVDIKHLGRIRDVDVYDDDIPFALEIINPEIIRQPATWHVTDSTGGVLFARDEDTRPQFIKYGQETGIGPIHIRFMPNLLHNREISADSAAPTRNYEVTIQTPGETTDAMVKKISVEAVSKNATVINLSIKDLNRKRGVAILQTLVRVYNEHGLKDKNIVTDNTVTFLNERLLAVSRELQEVEGSVERFKSDNRVTDLSADAQQFMIASQAIDAQRAQSQTQLNIISALERDLIINQENPQMVASTLGIQEPSLGALIAQHNELLLRKDRLQELSGPRNPGLVDMQQQVKELRNKLLTNVKNLKSAYMIAVNDVASKDNQLSGRIRNMPSLERKLLQITRNQNVQQQLYAFLLQKREEAAVSGASNIEDSRTIIRPRSVGVVSPRKIPTWGLAVLLGLLIPIVVVGVKDFMNNKIGDAAQVEERTSIPIIGMISHAKKVKNPIVINRTSRSVVAEQIRNIRTSIGYTGKGKDVQTILITSFQPGDGKSFISVNLAAGYALLNKKTVILEFDLRKPAVSKDLGITGKEGISSVLTGKKKVEDLIIELPGNDGFLYLLPAGFIPPNPAELISGSQMKKMIDDLKAIFDIVIIDTPPFSLVTDASLLQEYSDITLVVLRQDHTNKAVYNELRSLKSNGAKNPVYILLNDVGKRKRYDSGGYVYGKGYFVEDEA